MTFARPLFSIVLSLRRNHFQNQRMHSALKSFRNEGSSAPTPKRRVFCYGDSLTAGTAPPLDGLFPYGKSLESELGNDFVVRWRGLPGWTAKQMIEYLDDGKVGLRAVVDGIDDPPISIVIILAGTNDIGFMTSSMTTEPTDVDAAIKPITSLHEACIAINKGKHNTIRTLAVGIPGSAWQQMNTSASMLAADMNSSLQEFAQSFSDGRVNYTDFPFPYERNDLWSPDGLHLSPKGYDRLGRDLAPIVKGILSTNI